MVPPSIESRRIPSRDEIDEILRLVNDETARYLTTIEARPVQSGREDQAIEAFRAPLPDTGSGATKALREFVDNGLHATVTSARPHCFHFVIGGTMPTSLGADWLTSALDQMSYA